MSDKLRKWQVKAPPAAKPTGWKSVIPEALNAEHVVARAGTKVVCPQCGEIIGRLYSDLYSGVSCRADQIEFAPGQKKHPNQLAECAKCGAGYMKQSMSVRNGTRIILSVSINDRQRWI